MELDERAKRAASELGEAINSAVGDSARVAAAIERLRELGFEPNLTLKLEIGLLQMTTEIGDENPFDDDSELELTDEDIKTLQKMKIRISE